MVDIIMIVDDEADIRDVLVDVFESEGLAVVAFGNGRAALDYARLQPPSLALVDLLMPYMNGRELIQHLRGDYHATYPIIVMSASVNFMQVRDLPIQDYIAKPFDLDDVVERVRQALRARKATSSVERTAVRPTPIPAPPPFGVDRRDTR